MKKNSNESRIRSLHLDSRCKYNVEEKKPCELYRTNVCQKIYYIFFSELSIMILYTHNLLSYLLLTSKFTKFTNFFLSSKFPSRNEKTPIQLKLGSTGFWPLKMLKGSGSMQNFRTKISHNILREYLPKDFCKNAFFCHQLG